VVYNLIYSVIYNFSRLSVLRVFLKVSASERTSLYLLEISLNYFRWFSPYVFNWLSSYFSQILMRFIYS